MLCSVFLHTGFPSIVDVLDDTICVKRSCDMFRKPTDCPLPTPAQFRCVRSPHRHRADLLLSAREGFLEVWVSLRLLDRLADIQTHAHCGAAGVATIMRRQLTAMGYSDVRASVVCGIYMRKP